MARAMTPMGRRRAARRERELNLDGSSLERILSRIEKNPDLAKDLDAQEVYDKVIRPGEERRYRESLDRINKTAQGAQSAARARNSDLTARLGISGTQAAQGLDNALSTSAARELALQRAQAGQDYQERLNNSGRFSAFDRIQEAIKKGYQHRATGTQVHTNIAGTGASVAGALLSAFPLTAPAGAALTATGAGIIGAGQAASQGIRAQGNKQAGQLGRAVGDVNVANYGTRQSLPGGLQGYDFNPTGQGRAESLFRRMVDEDEEYAV